MATSKQRIANWDKQIAKELGMPLTHYKKLGNVARQLGKTIQEVSNSWDDETPHFAGVGPHRYEDGECVYCGRPKAYKPISK